MTDSKPWLTEPNEALWTDEATGYPCRILRQPTLGHLCGYVGVPSSHPFYGLRADEDLLFDSILYAKMFPRADAWMSEQRKVWGGAPLVQSQLSYHFSVHGGVTYSGFLLETVHNPRPDDREFFFLGFDCAHENDLSPMRARYAIWDEGATYKTFAFVEAEVNKLAKQLNFFEGIAK